VGTGLKPAPGRDINGFPDWFVSCQSEVDKIRSCSQKTLNIHVILNGAQRSEESRRLKKRDSSLRSE
jgi:hypothetical protein